MTTNEQAKQAAIIKAYGDTWKKLRLSTQSCALSNDGWIAFKESNPLIDSGMAVSCFQREYGLISEVRPTSLNNIEHNNGWTRINPDGSNIPEEVAYYEVCINGIPWGHPQPLQFLVRTFYSVTKEQLTHFRKWEPSKPPIY